MIEPKHQFKRKQERYEYHKNTWNTTLGAKRWISYFLLAISVIIVYKIFDNFGNVQEWFSTLFRVLKPFLSGILISYVLILPCRAIEKAYRDCKSKIIAKHSRGLGVLTTYIIALLIITIIVTFIFPILKESIVELFTSIPSYYEKVTKTVSELPEDSILKSDIAKTVIDNIQHIDIQEMLSLNYEKILEYVQNLFNVFYSIFDIFVSFVVSVYILLQRTDIMRFFGKLAKRIFPENTYNHIDKYFGQGNEMFFKFVGSQVIDAFIVGILTTIAMSIMGVKYAPLLGFMIGLFNIIPYIGAIIAVAIAIIITLITGGIGQAILMAVIVIILQQIDANIINPRIIGNSLEISPLLVILAVTVGGAYFGIIGMFLAVPVAALIKLILEDFVDEKQ